MYLSPFGNSQQLDANGAPLSGGMIYVYQAGTSTEATTYTDADGSASQENPIVLNARGIPDNPIWLQGGLSYKFIVKDADDVTLQTVDDVQGVNDPANVTTQDQWVTFGGAPTYVGATSFSLSGDQTPTFQVGRRLKTANAGGTVYSTITVSSYDGGTGLTSITVTNDSGTLDSSLSSVSYGMLSVTNPSIPANVLMKLTASQSLSGTSVDFTGIPTWAKRVSLNVSSMSTSGTSAPLFQIGDSGGVEATGYTGASSTITNGSVTATTAYTTGVGLALGQASNVIHGRLVFELLDAATNTWVAAGNFTRSDTPSNVITGSSKALSATLDRIRLTTANGTDTFDGGTASLLIEG